MRDKYKILPVRRYISVAALWFQDQKKSAYFNWCWNSNEYFDIAQKSSIIILPYNTRRDNEAWSQYWTEYECNICEKKYTTLSLLSQHKKYVHERVLKDYKCNISDKIFSSQNKLDKHCANFHENKKQYVCDQCEKYFATLACLNIHIRKIAFKI